jgi:dephospho-CoA kinase
VLKVGLTGGIASGKSTVLRLLSECGAQTLSADGLAHRLMEPGEAVYKAVVEHFGREILNLDGSICRPKLAALAFAGRIEELNALVHPAVLESQEKWFSGAAAADPHAVCVVEAALLLEASGQKGLDKLIAVTCGDEEERIRRFAGRTGTAMDSARAEVSRRLAAQMPEAEKAKLADYVIDNTGDERKLTLAVRELWRELRRLA